MSRAAALARRAELEDPQAPDALLAFATISHERLAQPIRVVSDVMSYRIGADLFMGIPFEAEMVTDGEGQAQTRLVMQAVTGRLPRAIRAVTGRASVRLDLRSSADFDLSQEPRVPNGELPPPIHGFRQFELRDVSGDLTQISGTLMLHDYTGEPFGLRATMLRCPGLFW